MFDTYFTHGPEDGKEYGRCAALIDGMQADLLHSRSATPGSLVAELDIQYAGSDPTPSLLLRNALEHAVHNLQFVTLTLEKFGGHSIPVTTLMSAIRTSLLGASHLAYVVSDTDLSTAAQRMGSLYQLESKSARKFVKQIDSPAARRLMPGMCPPPGSTVRSLAAYDPPHKTSGQLNESTLLDNLKTVVLPGVITATGHDPDYAQIMVDHLFNTTSGAAHGYGWINTDGVVAHVVAQLSFSTTTANIVFNHYFAALDS
ncbi:hypothetical protein [Rhodococcus sp. KRD197]|uniref:hypothetical protein n=2 Tax=unclassified Rhodococcus (in: high G+C Gram-positive bacteria) TaxID=192944 RepID=UPI003D1612F3